MWLTFLLLGAVLGSLTMKLLNSASRKSRTHYLNKALDNVKSVAKKNNAEDSEYIRGIIFGLEQSFKLTGTPRRKNKKYSEKIDKKTDEIAHLPKVSILIDTNEGELNEIAAIPENLTIDEFISLVIEQAESRGEKIISIYKENKSNNSYDIKLYEN